MDIFQLVNLTSRAWSLPILAAFHVGVPGRQAPLLARTGASRTAFLQSLAHLIELNLIERNPGYGHPLRPEFRLTATGIEAARLAHDILKSTPSSEQNLLRKVWTLPILATARQPIQFSQIRDSLPPITDRALSQSLQVLEQKQWIRRDILGEARPPRPLYCVEKTGLTLSRLVLNQTNIAA